MADKIVDWHKHLTAFRYWCHAVLPQVYDDSLSYYELLNKVVAYLNETRESVNDLKELVELIIDGDGDLVEIVNEIIQQMIEDGTFIDTIAPDLGYLRPEWFGAKADVVIGDELNPNATNDYQALQDCINAADEMEVPVVISGIYLCDATLNVPSHARIQGFSYNSAYQPAIRMGTHCTKLLNCDGVYIGLKDFAICPYNRGTYYPGSIGIEFTGRAYNIDSLVDGVTLYNTEIGIIVNGRNLELRNCGFSHHRVGVSYRLYNNEYEQYRGLNIENCRFHGIGEDSAVGWYENCTGIEIMNTYWSNLTVTNCVFEQAGTCIKGYATNVLFTNNFIEAFKYAPIIWGPSTYQAASGGAIQLFANNHITSKNTGGSLRPVCDHLIEIKNCENVVVQNNVLHRCRQNAITITDCNDIVVRGNVTGSIGTSGTFGMCYTANSFNTIIAENISVDATARLVEASGGSRKVSGNIGYEYNSSNTDSALSVSEQYIQIANANLGEAIPDNVNSRVFYVRKASPRTFLEIARFGDHYSSSTFVVDGTNLRYAKVDNNIIRMYTLDSTTGTETELTGEIFYYLITG